ncbi:MAG: hypothetical protein MI919_04505 [Holophagales bacterium]|nr:hypothetical protein [Holophagales bacterium]
MVPFFWDGGELVEIAREGDVLPFLGTLTSFTVPAADQDLPERSLLDERGQVALEINTSQTNGAIVLWTPPSLVFVDGFESGTTSGWSSAF